MSDITDLYIGDVIDQSQLLKNIRAAEKEAQEYTVDEWKSLRRLAKKNLWFLTTTILGYKKLSPGLHAHLCQWLQATEHWQFRELLLPRGHYKSTINTVADSIRAGLPDDDGDSPWPYCLGTNLRLCITHETDGAAQRFLFQISRHFLGNPILMGLFPEAIPSFKQQRINKGELELPRSEFWSEPTFDTLGVGAKAQGRHYNFLKCDDLFGDKARDSETERATTIDWFDNIQSFLSTFAKDHIDVIGTRYAMDDLYSHIHKVYGNQIIKYIRSCEERDPTTGKLVSIFPEEFPLEKLKILKRSPKTWIQYSNNPTSFLTKFRADWKQYYTYASYNRIAVVHGGQIGLNGLPLSQIRLEQIDIRDLDITILIDPAPEHEAGYIITGTDARMRVFVLKAKKKAFSPPELIEEIFADVARYRPRMVVIEEVNFSKVYRHWLKMEMPRRNIRFHIEPAKTKNREKSLRVDGLSNWFSGKQIFFNEGLTDLIEEYDLYGTISEYHLLDALAYGPEFWKPASNVRVTESRAKDEAAMLAERDMHTGYSTYE
jgi:hypothetical protein